VTQRLDQQIRYGMMEVASVHSQENACYRCDDKTRLLKGSYFLLNTLAVFGALCGNGAILVVCAPANAFNKGTFCFAIFLLCYKNDDCE
jgi:hypothetical protein